MRAVPPGSGVTRRVAPKRAAGRDAKLSPGDDPLAPAGLRPHLRLEPRRRRGAARARPRGARRRNPPGRPAVAVRQEPLDRPEDPDPAPHGGSRHRLGRHRPPGRRPPRRRDRDAPGPGDRARKAQDPAQLRGAHRRRRHRADHRDLPESRDPDRGVLLHRLLADPPVRRRLGLRPHAADVGGRRLPGRARRAPGHVRHRRHDTRASGPCPCACTRPRSAPERAASACATRWDTRRPTACGTWWRSCRRSSTRSTPRSRSTGTVTRTGASA